ncbi:heme exporter protein CcmB [Halobacterium noricense]|uniref:heme exporter protein CcmB n=1 Tax=Halobacterium noricense TaxID=223182 RepID=UPI001E32EEB9|nr:heme exporter protein CcmB [Halobacterium noricense]UHH27137.1 heme exporter protein CcmB [Halobacterium noricense]
MTSYLTAVYLVMRKDLHLEVRTKQVTTTAAVFALLVVLAFAFGFVKTFTDPQVVGRSALWVAFVFAGTLGVTEAADVEAQHAALDGLLLAPVDRSAVYVGKVLSTTAFVLAVDLVTLAATGVFLGYELALSMMPALVGVLGLAAFGFSAVGVVVSTLTFRSSLGELVLPVLLVPLVVPVLLAGVELTAALTTGAPTGTWLRVLGSYAGILFLGGLVTFEYAVEE